MNREPLPFKYDENNQLVVDIMKQVVDFCKLEVKDKEELWQQIWLVIRAISALACWTDNSDDTFIVQSRYQSYFSTSSNCMSLRGCCVDTTLKIPLDYPLFEEEWIRASITVKGEFVDIPLDYLKSHYHKATNSLIIDRKDFQSEFIRKCPETVLVDLFYISGYQKIPSGLLPLICKMLDKVKSSGASAEGCLALVSRPSGSLKRKTTGNVTYEWNNNPSEETHLVSDLYNIASMAELATISRCAILEESSEMGDVI